LLLYTCVHLINLFQVFILFSFLDDRLTKLFVFTVSCSSELIVFIVLVYSIVHVVVSITLLANFVSWREDPVVDEELDGALRYYGGWTEQFALSRSRVWLQPMSNLEYRRHLLHFNLNFLFFFLFRSRLLLLRLLAWRHDIDRSGAFEDYSVVTALKSTLRIFLSVERFRWLLWRHYCTDTFHTFDDHDSVIVRLLGYLERSRGQSTSTSSVGEIKLSDRRSNLSGACATQRATLLQVLHRRWIGVTVLLFLELGDNCALEVIALAIVFTTCKIRLWWLLLLLLNTYFLAI